MTRYALPGGRSHRLVAGAFIVAALALSAAIPPSVQADGPGTAQGAAMALDARSGHVYIAHPLSNAVFVLAAKGMRLLTVLDVPPAPTAIAVDPERGRVYVASSAAGMISAFDDRTFNLLHIYPVGGNPSGLTLADHGKTLLIGDGVSGATQQLATLAHGAQPRQVFTSGTPGTSLALLAPATSSPGQQMRVWARGFTPGEPVRVYWEWQPLVPVTANAVGIVKATFEVPQHVALDTHLVILNGAWSKISVSALLHVVAAPPRPKLHHKVQVKKLPLLQQVLAPAVTVPIPAAVVRLYAQLMHHGTGTTAPRAKTSAARAPVTHGQVQGQRHAPAQPRPAAQPQSTAKSRPLQQRQPATAPAAAGVSARVPLVFIALEGLILLALIVRKMLRRRSKRRSKVEKGKGRTKGRTKGRPAPAVDRAA